MSSASFKTLGGDGILPPAAEWAEGDELGLMRTVQEMAQEPAEAFDPSVSPFARIERNLSRRFARSEILTKVKELRRRYEAKCNRIRNGGAHDGGGIINEEMFEISERVWGMRKNEDSRNNKRKGKKAKKKKKKKKKVHIDKLLNGANKLFARKRFLAIISSCSEKYRLECHRKRSSENGFCSSSSTSNFIPMKFETLTENVTLRHSSYLLRTALNDVDKDQEHHEHHQDVTDKPNQYQEASMVVSSQLVAIEDLLSNGSETRLGADEANGRTFLTESSCVVAKKRPRLTLEACTVGKGCESAGNMQSSGMKKSVGEPVRHEYPKNQITEEPQLNPRLDPGTVQMAYRPVMEYDDLCPPSSVPESDDLFSMLCHERDSSSECAHDSVISDCQWILQTFDF